MSRQTIHIPTPAPSRSVVALAALALLLTGGGGLLFAGPLDPPAGPVTSTYKTLTEVEPRIAINATNTPGDVSSLYKITQPGSYYLTGNIVGVAGKHGIVIGASGVTLDLNGFDVSGVPGMGVFDGVRADGNGLVNITIMNGSIRGWGDDGLDLRRDDSPSRGADNCRIANILANGNAQSGITTGGGSVAGVGTTISNCSASGNGAFGIRAVSGSTITGCSACLNTGTGILGAGSNMSNRAANGNSRRGCAGLRAIIF